MFSDLKVRVLDNGAYYELLTDLNYCDEFYNVTAPKGFITDFASVPRVFWGFLPPFGRYTKASVIHDYACDLARNKIMTRKEADKLFYRAMKKCNVKSWKSKIMYVSVRAYAILKGLK